MARTYSDPSYGSKKQVTLPVTLTLEGSNSSAFTLESTHKFMTPVTVTDVNYTAEVAGTGTATSLLVGYLTGGTGSFTAIGTASAAGTQDIEDVIDDSVTETNLSTGDEIAIYGIGTDNDFVTTYVPHVQYKERFVVSDS